MEKNIIDSIKSIPGVTVKEGEASTTITIYPQKRAVKLRENKNGKGYSKSYTLSVSTAEAVSAGFIGSDGRPLELKKVVDPVAHTLTISLL